MDGMERDDFQKDDFIEAKSRLPDDLIAEIVAERRTFLDPELGRKLAPLGAVREPSGGSEEHDSEWMIDPAFRDFLKRSV